MVRNKVHTTTEPFPQLNFTISFPAHLCPSPNPKWHRGMENEHCDQSIWAPLCCSFPLPFFLSASLSGLICSSMVSPLATTPLRSLLQHETAYIHCYSFLQNTATCSLWSLPWTDSMVPSMGCRGTTCVTSGSSTSCRGINCPEMWGSTVEKRMIFL